MRVTVPSLGPRMASNVADSLDQRAGESCNDRGLETICIGPVLIPNIIMMAPFPIGRENDREPRHFWAVVRKSCGVGIVQRLGDVLFDVLGIPFIGKANIKEIRAQRLLRDKAGLVKGFARISPVQKKGLFHELTGAVSILVSKAADVSSFFRPRKFDGAIFVVAMKGGQRWAERSCDGRHGCRPDC